MAEADAQGAVRTTLDCGNGDSEVKAARTLKPKKTKGKLVSGFSRQNIIAKFLFFKKKKIHCKQYEALNLKYTKKAKPGQS